MDPKIVTSKSKTNSELTKSIYQELFPKKMSKSDQRKIDIIEGAITAYSKTDYTSVSFDDIASPAKTNRRLVQHYFPNKDELFELSIKVIRGHMQSIAVEALLKAIIPQEQFNAYIRSTFQWLKLKPTHVRAWILFFLVCTQKPKFKKIHSDLTKIGEKRITSLLLSMDTIKDKDPSNLSYLSKTIQRLITGGLIEASTEKSDNEIEIEIIQEETLKTCNYIIQSISCLK